MYPQGKRILVCNYKLELYLKSACPKINSYFAPQQKITFWTNELTSYINDIFSVKNKKLSVEILIGIAFKPKINLRNDFDIQSFNYKLGISLYLIGSLKKSQ